MGAGLDSTAAPLAGAVHPYNKVDSTWTLVSTLTHAGARLSHGLARGCTNSGLTLEQWALGVVPRSRQRSRDNFHHRAALWRKLSRLRA